MNGLLYYLRLLLDFLDLNNSDSIDSEEGLVTWSLVLTSPSATSSTSTS